MEKKLTDEIFKRTLPNPRVSARAFVLDTDGIETPVEPHNSDGFRLSEMYQLLDCDTVQLVELADGREMWLDEESKLKEITPPVNFAATRLLAEAGGIPGDVILGKVLICDVGMTR
jgi:Domain of unknown function (DUF3846)